MSDALSDDGHGFWRFCPRDVSAYSLVCGPTHAGTLIKENEYIKYEYSNLMGKI